VVTILSAYLRIIGSAYEFVLNEVVLGKIFHHVLGLYFSLLLQHWSTLPEGSRRMT